jgi:hypothetical protein
MKNLNLNMNQMLTREQMKKISGKGKSSVACDEPVLCFGSGPDSCVDPNCYCATDEPVMGLPGSYLCEFID